MDFYPSWVIALDEAASNPDGAHLSRQDAKWVIEAIAELADARTAARDNAHELVGIVADLQAEVRRLRAGIPS